MGRTNRKRRSTLANRAIAASAALALGGGGLLAANIYASAGEGKNSTQNAQTTGRRSGDDQMSGRRPAADRCAEGGTRRCRQGAGEARPAGHRGLQAPRRHAPGPGGGLQLRQQRHPRSAEVQADGHDRPDQHQHQARRAARLRREPTSSPGARACRPTEINAGEGQGQNNGGQDQGGQGQDQRRPGPRRPRSGPGRPGQRRPGSDQGATAARSVNGPVAADFQDITQVQPTGGAKGVGANGLPANGDGGSTGTFTTSCGTNGNDNHNSDNVIVAPGVDNGAQHTHDYVGNQDNNAFASDQEFLAGRHQLPEPGRQVVVLLAGAASAGRYGRVRRERPRWR